MADTKRDCPYCKETVKPDAVLCKHCGSELEPESEGHGGTCPFCRESIKSDALKCKHCRSVLAAAGLDDGGTHACICPTGPSVVALRAPVQNQSSFGQECFYDCIDRHIGHGDTYGPGLHRHCENKCQVSMPTQALVAAPTHLTRF